MSKDKLSLGLSGIPLVNEERKKEYQICKSRGHVKSRITPDGWNVCKCCHTQYKFEWTLKELYAPEEE